MKATKVTRLDFVDHAAGELADSDYETVEYAPDFPTEGHEMNKATSSDYIDGYHFEKRSEMRLPKKTSLGKSSVVRVPLPTPVFYLDGIEIDYQTGLNIEARALDYLYPYHDEVNDHEHYRACALRDFLALVEAL